MSTSPVAARVLPETGGVVRGKDALRYYWTTALAQQPDLRFEVIGPYRGESTLVINYRNHRGQLVNEVLTFDDDGLVRERHGTYLELPSAKRTFRRGSARERLQNVHLARTSSGMGSLWPTRPASPST